MAGGRKKTFSGNIRDAEKVSEMCVDCSGDGAKFSQAPQAPTCHIQVGAVLACGLWSVDVAQHYGAMADVARQKIIHLHARGRKRPRPTAARVSSEMQAVHE